MGSRAYSQRWCYLCKLKILSSSYGLSREATNAFQELNIVKFTDPLCSNFVCKQNPFANKSRIHKSMSTHKIQDVTHVSQWINRKEGWWWKLKTFLWLFWPFLSNHNRDGTKPRLVRLVSKRGKNWPRADTKISSSKVVQL